MAKRPAGCEQHQCTVPHLSTGSGQHYSGIHTPQHSRGLTEVRLQLDPQPFEARFFDPCIVAKNTLFKQQQQQEQKAFIGEVLL